MVEVDAEIASARSFMEAFSAQHPRVLHEMKARHLAATAHKDALDKIHQALAAGVLHADEAVIVKKMAKNLAKSIRHLPFKPVPADVKQWSRFGRREPSRHVQVERVSS